MQYNEFDVTTKVQQDDDVRAEYNSVGSSPQNDHD